MAMPTSGAVDTSLTDHAAKAPAPPNAWRDWRRHSLLLALLALLVGFELLGRLVNTDLRELYAQAFAGDVSWAEVLKSVGASLTSSDLSFLSARNLTNLTIQVAVTGVLAVGMTLVILTGGIDLSVGSVVALSGVALGLVDRATGGDGVVLAFAAAIGTGLLTGVTSGALIARFKITPFVITLGMLVIARGLALILSNSSAIAPVSASIRFAGGGFLPGYVAVAALAVGIALIAGPRVKALCQSRSRLTSWITPELLLGAAFAVTAAVVFLRDRGLPMPTTILAVVAVAFALLARHTVFGRSLYAIGGNEHAAVLSGLPVTKVKIGVYALMGTLSGVCGLILAGRLNSATPTEGQLLELDAIASAVIGGASLTGGVGTVIGSVVGAFIIGTLNSGMDMLEISSNWQMVVKGVIIVFAVYSDAKLRRAAV